MAIRALPLVSIVIVSWNARDYLAECLASLTSEVYAGPMETIVVDNASSDGSADMVRDRFPEVRLIRNDQNLGFAKANNIGIRIAKGDYLALVNSDVRVLKDCLGTLVEYCESDRRAGIVGPKIIGRDGHQQPSCRGFPRLWNTLCRALALDVAFSRSSWFNGFLLLHQDHTTRMPADILSGCFWLVRREALTQVGLLDEAFFIYGEDMDWCKRFWQAGWTAMFVPEAQAVHYGGASSANAPIRFSVEMQRADCQYWAKHHSRAAYSGYVAISVLNHAIRSIAHGTASLLSNREAASSHRQLALCSFACLKWIAFERPTGAAVSRVKLERPQGSRSTR